MNKSSVKLGIDFGKVIIAPIKDGRADTSFLDGAFEKAMNTLPSDRAFESIRGLVDYFNGNVWVISKCSEGTQKKTLSWLNHWNFFNETGFSKEKIIFCLERGQKAIICEKLEISHFLDDRLDVLEPMRPHVKNLFLFGEQRVEIPSWVEHVPNWMIAKNKIIGSLPSFAN